MYLEAERQLAQLRVAILELSQPDKSIILLFLESLPYRQIAEIIGVSENYIAVRVKRIKEKRSKKLKTRNYKCSGIRLDKSVFKSMRTA